MEIIKRPSISSSYEHLVKVVWNCGNRITDQRKDTVRSLENIWIEIESDKIDYPPFCPIAQPIAEYFVNGLIDKKTAMRVGIEHDYGYGARIRENNALENCIEILSENPNSRRANLPIYNSFDPEQSVNGNEVPCVINAIPTIKNNKLDLTVFMRSNDVVNAYPTDAYGFRRLQELIAKELNRDVGSYYHFIKNAHIIEHSSEDWIKNTLVPGRYEKIFVCAECGNLTAKTHFYKRTPGELLCKNCYSKIL